MINLIKFLNNLNGFIQKLKNNLVCSSEIEATVTSCFGGLYFDSLGFAPVVPCESPNNKFCQVLKKIKTLKSNAPLLTAVIGGKSKKYD